MLKCQLCALRVTSNIIKIKSKSQRKNKGLREGWLLGFVTDIHSRLPLFIFTCNFKWSHIIGFSFCKTDVIDPHPPLCVQRCITVWLIMRPICASRHPHVHPGTAAVNQTAGSLAIKGRTFATDNHSISKSHQMNI